MANVRKRIGKNGEVTYQLRAFLHEDFTGKQVTKSMTWKPPTGMKESTADKQAEKEAILFEEKVKTGVVSIDGSMKFADYAARWLESREVARNTVNYYNYALERINKAIGHIPLEKLRVEHVQQFYKNLREEGVKQGPNGCAQYEVDKFVEYCNKAGIRQCDIVKQTGLSSQTLSGIFHGRRVYRKTADRIAAALEIKTDDVFYPVKYDSKLSDRTIKVHHCVIRAILISAKKSRIINENILEYMDAPKESRKEARFLNDEEARLFLFNLLNEPNIKIKTALFILLFSGVRKGELCGLTWGDIDFNNNIIHVRRAVQYTVGYGVYEAQTKTEGSERDIIVSPYVMIMLREYYSWWITFRENLGDSWQGDKDWLFSQRSGKALSPYSINAWLSRYLKGKDLPEISPHSLRHTFITLQIAAGVDVKTLSAQTGHANPTTLLNVYAHTMKSAQEKAAQLLENALMPPGSGKGILLIESGESQ